MTCQVNLKGTYRLLSEIPSRGALKGWAMCKHYSEQIQGLFILIHVVHQLTYSQSNVGSAKQPRISSV